MRPLPLCRVVVCPIASNAGSHQYRAAFPRRSMGLLRGVIDSVKGHDDRPDELYISPRHPEMRKVLNCEVVRLHTKPIRGGGGNTQIIAAWISYKTVVPTMLFSHGNAVDLGQMLPFYRSSPFQGRELSKELHINVLGYDYSGYGCSTGTPSVSNAIADINACYQFLLQVKRKRPQDIVIYGQSVGSGPTCDIAAAEKDVKGVVLHSPLMSGMRCLSPNMNRWPAWANVFPNITLLPKIEAKTFIMHGDMDEVVPFAHGQALHAAAKNPYPPLWACGYGHQNLEFCKQYLPSLHEYLRKLFGREYGML
ncbi:hypothetical protein ABBQ32_009534 [Trebouxia sp. C0010 RCD-2024]